MTAINDILIPRFKEAFTLSCFQAMRVLFAFFGVCFVGAFIFCINAVTTGGPIARLGHKNGFIIGLLLSANGADCTSASSTGFVPGSYFANLLISTRAGHTLGAGCLAAGPIGLDDTGIVLVGNCASDHFVWSARSAALSDMAKLLDAWTAGPLTERL